MSTQSMVRGIESSLQPSLSVATTVSAAPCVGSRFDLNPLRTSTHLEALHPLLIGTYRDGYRLKNVRTG